MLRDKLNEALKDAMRARDMASVGAIRLILAKLKEVDIAARTETSREGVADERILSMLQGMIKQRNESVALYEKGNRPDLADKEKAEIVVIERFLPRQMDDSAVEAAVREAVAGFCQGLGGGKESTYVILSVAKDLMPVASGDEILRYAQDDRKVPAILCPVSGASRV